MYGCSALIDFQGRVFQAVVMLTLLTTVPVMATLTFSCGLDTCIPAQGQYCEEERCTSCNRYVDNYLSNTQATQFLPPECAYYIYYGLKLSNITEENKTLQGLIQAMNGTAGGLEQRLVEVTAENGQLKDQVDYYWKWIIAMTVCCAIVAVIVIMTLTVVIIKGSPKLWTLCLRKRKENRALLPDRLLQVSPTEEGNESPSTVTVC